MMDLANIKNSQPKTWYDGQTVSKSIIKFLAAESKIKVGGNSFNTLFNDLKKKKKITKPPINK